MFLILLPLPFTGIIPAHAGLTSAAAAHGLRVEDHPRGCGAHVKPSSGAASRAGSPPRVRGSQYGRHQSTHAPGIIPAGAGLTHADPTKWAAYRDHPRGCGAHSAPADCGQTGPGSSPRMRGSLCTADVLGVREGIIPAGAGLT